jgi:hypothetical protein
VIVEFDSEFEELIQKGLCQGFDSTWERREKNGSGKAGILKSGGLLEGVFLALARARFSLVLDLAAISIVVGSDILR